MKYLIYKINIPAWWLQCSEDEKNSHSRKCKSELYIITRFVPFFTIACDVKWIHIFTYSNDKSASVLPLFTYHHPRKRNVKYLRIFATHIHPSIRNKCTTNHVCVRATRDQPSHVAGALSIKTSRIRLEYTIQCTRPRVRYVIINVSRRRADVWRIKGALQIKRSIADAKTR